MCLLARYSPQQVYKESEKKIHRRLGLLFVSNPKRMFKLLGLLLCCWASLSAGRLTTSGRDFYYNAQKVFLSGANIAWNSYGYDFGNGQYTANSKSTLESWLTQISTNGGNSIRKSIKFCLIS